MRDFGFRKKNDPAIVAYSTKSWVKMFLNCSFFVGKIQSRSVPAEPRDERAFNLSSRHAIERYSGPISRTGCKQWFLFTVSYDNIIWLL